MTAREQEEIFIREHRQARSMAELRTENKLLRRKVARLEKQLRRYRGEDVEGPDEDVPAAPIVVIVNSKKCPECESTQVEPFQTPNKLIHVCKACKHRF